MSEHSENALTVVLDLHMVPGFGEDEFIKVVPRRA